MAMHLFSTPVQCTHCGTVVDDPMVDKCPNCGNLLKERRTPSRLAGVERRYGQLRLLLGLLRFLGVITVAVGLLLFAFGDESTPWSVRLVSLLGAILLAVGLFVVAALIDVALDIEENTRSTFRLQQLVLESMQAGGTRATDTTRVT
jgi:predicted RNA-binding Zn-ribbon protein involved in translation (DUF1610 family)